MFFSPSLAGSTIKERIDGLEPYISVYPPNISTKEEFEKIQTEYLAIKAELDQILLKNAKDIDALYLRGWLYTLGHNINHPIAWRGAKSDLEALIKEDKNNIPARIKLGKHLVNSKPEFASHAENLFREAQCLSGNEPVEKIQNGLFFAFYYQGKMQKAYKQVSYLAKTWPKNEQYKTLKETVLDVLNRTNSGIPDIKKHELISFISD